MFSIFTIRRTVALVALLQLFITGHVPILLAADEASNEKGKIEGIVFNDSNKDAILDQGEVLRTGIMIRLLDQQGKQLAEQPTTSLGSFGFANLIPGIYQLRISFSTEVSIRTVGIKVAPESPEHFLAIPVITDTSDYDFVELGLVNDDTVDGEEATAFMP